MIKNDQSVADKLVEKTLIGAEYGDKITWEFLWNAHEAEVRDKQPDLEINSDKYLKAISDRLRDVVYRTQVVAEQ